MSARTVNTTSAVSWSLFDPAIRVGDRIRSTRYGAGEVIRIGRGYAEHSCPDHGEADCTCGGNGRVAAMQPYPVVRYSDGKESCISPEDEGERWERDHASDARDPS